MPVIEYLATFLEVDTSAVFLLGSSSGGYLAPRAAVFEHRLANVLSLDCFDDAGRFFKCIITPTQLAVFVVGSVTAFDAI